MAIAAGGYHNLALKADGSVVAWGYNTSGQTTVPQGINSIAAIAAGESHSLALATLEPGTPQPLIISPAFALGETGNAFYYRIRARNSATSYDATGLPSGLNIDKATGIISGTPPASGSYTVTLSAKNAAGTTPKALILKINQAPPVATSVAIVTPNPGTQLTQASLTVTGTAQGTFGVDHVEVTVSGYAGTTYTSRTVRATGTTSWTAAVTLFPRNNDISATAVDAAGNRSNHASIGVYYLVTGHLTVSVHGSGTVSAGYFGVTTHEIGDSLTITATPDPGFFFAGWTGSLTSAEATLGFVMTDGLLLTANFEEIPVVKLAVLALVGTPVPGAGEPDGPPDGSVFASFGVPAVDPSRGMVVRVTIKAGRKLLDGVYLNDATTENRLLAFQTAAAAGGGRATFKSFGDPLVSESGVAFSAKLSDGRSGVWTTAFGSGLELVAMTGGEAPGISESKIATIMSFSLRGGEIVALLKLKPGSGGATAATDTVVGRFSTGDKSLLLQKGQPIEADGLAASKITKISMFTPAPECPGQDRSHAAGLTVAKVTLADTREVALSMAADGTKTPFAFTRLGKASGFKTVGLPAAGAAGFASLKAVRKPEAGGAGGLGKIGPTNDEQIDLYRFGSSGFESENLAQEGATLAGTGLGCGTLTEPAVNDHGDVAFFAKLSGDTVLNTNNRALVVVRGNSGLAELAARTGDSAPDATGAFLTGVTFAKFVLFGLPNGGDVGPIFAATLAGAKSSGVTAKNSSALYGVDSTGLLRQLLRTGDLLHFAVEPDLEVAKTVSGFTALTGGANPLGGRRAFTTAGCVAVRVVFNDKSTSIVRVTLP